jgi:hypothetical protein
MNGVAGASQTGGGGGPGIVILSYQTSVPSGTGNGGNVTISGSPGIVKIAYPGTQQIGTGGTTSTTCGYFFHSFTSPGTYIG